MNSQEADHMNANLGTTIRLAVGLGLCLGMASSLAPPVAAQQPAAGRPNILVIWGDDIGTWNISHNNRGMMGYKTPNIDRIAEGRRRLHRLLRAAELHRRPRRLHQRLRAGAHRHDQGRHARRRGRLAEDRRHHGHGAEEPGLRHRPVRQEPPGRPRRAPADDARLRRVPRQPLSPQRRGGAGEPRLSEGHEARQRQDLPRDSSVPRGVHQVQGRRQGRPDHREHRPAHQEAHGDDRRRDPGRRQGLHHAPGQGRHSRSSAGGTAPACISART